MRNSDNNGGLIIISDMAITQNCALYCNFGLNLIDRKICDEILKLIRGDEA